MSKDSSCILVICLLRSLMEEHIAEARSMGLITNSLPEASRRGWNFNCYSRQSFRPFRVLFPFLWSFVWYSFYQSIQTAQIADIPCAGIANAIWKSFVTFDGTASLFQNFANTTSRQSFLLEGLNRFSLDKYPSFWHVREKLPKFFLNEHWETRQFSDAIPLHFSSRKKLPCWLKHYFRGFYVTGSQYDWVSCDSWRP